jgi:hypothetical protein
MSNIHRQRRAHSLVTEISFANSVVQARQFSSRSISRLASRTTARNRIAAKFLDFVASIAASTALN